MQAEYPQDQMAALSDDGRMRDSGVCSHGDHQHQRAAIARPYRLYPPGGICGMLFGELWDLLRECKGNLEQDRAADEDTGI